LRNINEAEERSKQLLDNVVKNYKIFIDTCSLLDIYADKFWQNILPLLQRERKSIIIPYRVYEEVDKYASDPQLCVQKKPSGQDLNSRALKAKKAIVTLQNAGIVEIFGNKNDNFADNVFQTVFTQFRLKYNLLLITQDNDLAIDILNISKSKSVNSKNQILVKKINKYGYLSSIGTFVQKPQQQFSSQSMTVESVDIPDSERFAFAKEIVSISGKISVSYIPKEGDVATAERNGQRRPVKLITALNSGGEGTIFTTDIPNVVAKVYKQEKIDKLKLEKIKLMLTKDIDCPGVCFPIALLYNTKNEFVGYLMEKAQGTDLQKCVFIPKLLNKRFPNWKKTDTVALCVTILRKLKYLHDRNIILGDINPNNILVVSPTEVYFVDTDSYQIEGFPCPVGTINFTAPEIQRKRYDTFLRTMGNERFAVATLLFMIMLPGKPPYSLQGGENQIDNIINGDFPYASGERSTGKAPVGMWRYCWSHLPRYIKDDFYETFRKDGKHCTERTRYSTGDWLIKFERYLDLLKSGKLAMQDEESMELFPSRLKKNINATYIKCRLCGNDVDEDRTEQGICQDCLQKGKVYHCKNCGRELIYTNYQKLIKKLRKYELCRECYENSIMVYTRLRCTDCGKMFEVNYGEKDFYESKGWQLPKRCANCRGNNKSGSPTQQSSTPKSSGSAGSGRLCFITTAVCKYCGKPDDCYELETLRSFRDNWLLTQPSGSAIIEEYYRIAPIIVTTIDASGEQKAIYKNILDKYILPCIRLIELGAYSTCRDLYIEMVNSLKDKYVKE